MERGFVTIFERKVLFRIARFVAFSICLGLFLALIGGGIYFLSAGMKDVVRPNPMEVADSLNTLAAAAPSTAAEGDDAGGLRSQSSSSALSGIKVPPTLQELILDGENHSVFEGWLDALPKQERQPFVDGLAKAMTQGRKASLADSDVVNEYHKRYVEYVAEKQAAEALAKTQRLYAAGALVSTLILLALFSLVLVLLAIERNTVATPTGPTA